jgi:hypothetical protein
MANKFTLHGHDVEISYTIGANPSFPALIYTSGSLSKDFLPDAIHTDPTELGNLVTVSLSLTIDAGGTTFSVFLPTIDVPMGQSVAFTTVGVYKEVTGPVVLPAQQHTTWRTIHLHGKAETVIVPLVQTAAA